MARMVKTRILILGLWFISLLGCGDSAPQGTDTGNPTALRIEFVGQATEVTLTEARIVVKALDFDPIALCETESESEDDGTEDDDADQPGPFVVDLLNNTSTPDTDSFQILSGSFCELDVDFDLLEEEDVPEGIEADDPIVGNALIVEGRREDETPFEMRLSQDDKFKLVAGNADGFAIEGSDSVLFIAFDIDTWFTGIDLDDAVVSDGVILLNNENNTILRGLIVENIKQSARLYHDLNNNSILDEDETTEGFILANGEDEED